MELLLGCGNKRVKLIAYSDAPKDWTELVTLDVDPSCRPDVEHDMMRLPLPFADDVFDEIHGYHILEHTGAQGDYKWFFAQWADFWRILKPDGLFCGLVPGVDSEWAWGDPGHSRVIPPAIFTFLDQTEYTRQVGVTALADYRRWYRADFWLEGVQRDEENRQFMFVLRAIKPSRISV